MIETEGPVETEFELEPPSAARRAFVTTVIVVATIVGVLALWKLRLVVALLLAAITISAAMRPGVEWLASKRIPRAVGVLLHYLVLIGLVALFLGLAVPRLTNEVQAALAIKANAHTGSGVKDKVLNAIAKKLHHLPAAGALVHPALSAGEEAMKVLVGILFTFAAAAYWLFEREHAIGTIASLFPRPRRKKLRDTWDLIEQKLGAFIRGQILMIVFVATVASGIFTLVGEPYALLIGIATGLLEVIPVVGPFVAIVLTAGAGLTVSWHTAALAAGLLLTLRLLQDYLISPRVLGGAVGLPPLAVLISVSAVGILLGPFYVLLSVPIAALVVTIVDVAVRGADPTEAEVPAVIFTPKDAE
ncbi:MAG TPA: AI-2E family transporter [Gaiellaceae bacterium]|jgi:predicted PurR-regulated permease PerM|nr:AI-2E family transporter [Gaiellaceae bacterium]